MNKIKDHKYKIKIFFIFTILYLSLILGFVIEENLAGGAIYDFSISADIILSSFKNNLSYYFFNYQENFETDHSPFYFLILHFLYFPFENITILRLLFLHICLLVPFVFYKCLIEKFSNCSKEILLILSSIVLLSPYFRSYSIWLGDINLALLFLLLSILYFFKLEKEEKGEKKYFYIFLHILFLALSAYVRPIYCIISIYFLYRIFIKYNFSKELFFYILTNIILSLPAFYYIYILDNIFFEGRIVPDINLLSNNSLIFSNIFLFYSLPFLYLGMQKNLKQKLLSINKNYLIILLSFVSTIFLIYNFNYNPSQSGGGIFFKFSNLIFKNNSFFYIISFVSVFFILKLVFDKKVNDLLIILILLLLDPDSYVFHKTYDPLLICIFLLLFENSLFNKFEKKNEKNFTFILFIFYIMVFLMYIIIRV